MPKAGKKTTTSRLSQVAPPPMPAMPPPSAEEQALSASISSQIQELIVIVTQQNLDRAIKLAELARRGRLPKELEAHFGELGRRYAALVDQGGLQNAPAVRLVTRDGAGVSA